jgi:hypothetical protein
MISMGTIGRDGVFFSAGIGTVLTGWLAGAMFSCGHGESGPTQIGQGGAAGGGVATPGSATPVAKAPPGPPAAKEGDTIDVWRVVQECKTLIEVDARTVGYTKYTISCSGCPGPCRLFKYPKAVPKTGKAGWTAVSEQSSPGVPVEVATKVTVKEFDNAPNFWYKCLCVSYD